jgi:hypothetical protein
MDCWMDRVIRENGKIENGTNSVVRVPATLTHSQVLSYSPQGTLWRELAHSFVLEPRGPAEADVREY